MESSSSTNYVSATLRRYYQLTESLRYFSSPFIVARDWNQSPSYFTSHDFADMIPGGTLAL
eukprot:8950280-Pyramimonas_sp.AAC.1